MHHLILVAGLITMRLVWPLDVQDRRNIQAMYKNVQNLPPPLFFYNPTKILQTFGWGIHAYFIYAFSCVLHDLKEEKNKIKSTKINKDNLIFCFEKVWALSPES